MSISSRSSKSVSSSMITPTTLRPHPARKCDGPRLAKVITSESGARKTMRNCWSSPPKTWATVACPTRHRSPTHASSR